MGAIEEARPEEGSGGATPAARRPAGGKSALAAIPSVSASASARPHRPRRPLAQRLFALLQDCYACAVGSVVVGIMVVGAACYVAVLPLWVLGFRVAYERVSHVISQASGAPIFMYVIYVTKLRGFQYGDEYLEPAFLHKHVMTMNHQSWVDVPFFLGLFFFTQGIASSRWVCWRSLLKYPMIWVAYLKGDVFIPCVWREDQPLLARSIAWFNRSPLARTYVFFPEGAIKRRATMAKSVAYCRQLGIEPLRHLLWPRHKALALVLDAIRAHQRRQLLKHGGGGGGTAPDPAAFRALSDDACAGANSPRFKSSLGISDGYLYDITVGYEGFDGRPPRLLDCFIPRGRPLGVHMHFRRFLLSSLPEEEEALALWIQKLYRQKDELLACFHANGAFPTAANGHGPIGPLRERRPPDWRGVFWTLAYLAFVASLAACLCAGVAWRAQIERAFLGALGGALGGRSSR